MSITIDGAIFKLFKLKTNTKILKILHKVDKYRISA